MDAGGEQQRGGGVPQIVEANHGQFCLGEQRLELVDVEASSPSRRLWNRSVPRARCEADPVRIQVRNGVENM
jgi:hypothetical protein